MMEAPSALREQEPAVLEPLPSEELALLCHDLRSPLTTIAGALCILEDACEPGLPAHAQRALEAGLRALDRMTDMLSDLEARAASAKVGTSS